MAKLELPMENHDKPLAKNHSAEEWDIALYPPQPDLSFNVVAQSSLVKQEHSQGVTGWPWNPNLQLRDTGIFGIAPAHYRHTKLSKFLGLW